MSATTETPPMNAATLHKIQSDAEAELGNALYAAARIIEEMENKGLILGNGHHARQTVAAFGVAELRKRWNDPQPGLSMGTDWQRSTAQRDREGGPYRAEAA